MYCPFQPKQSPGNRVVACCVALPFTPPGMLRAYRGKFFLTNSNNYLVAVFVKYIPIQTKVRIN